MPRPLPYAAPVIAAVTCLVLFLLWKPADPAPEEGSAGAPPSTTGDAPTEDIVPGRLPAEAERAAIDGGSSDDRKEPGPSAAGSDAAPGLDENTASISGRLELADGTPLAGYRIQLLSVAEGSATGAAWTESGRDGGFAFRGLRSGGQYRARLWAKYGAPSSHEPSTLEAPFPGVALQVEALLVRGSWPTAVDGPSPGSAVEVSVHPFGCEDPPFGTATELEEAGQGGTIERLLPVGCGYVVTAKSKGVEPAAFRVPIGSGPGLFVGLLENISPDLGTAQILVDGVVPDRARLDLRIDAVEGSFPFPVPHLSAVANLRAGVPSARLVGLIPGQYSVTTSMGGTPPFGYVLPELSDPRLTIEPGSVSEIKIRLAPAGLLEVIVAPSAEGSDPNPSFLVEFRRASDTEWSPLYTVDPAGGPPRGNIPPNKLMVTMDTLPEGPLTLRAQSPGWTSQEVSANVSAGETTRYTIPVQPKG